MVELKKVKEQIKEILQAESQENPVKKFQRPAQAFKQSNEGEAKKPYKKCSMFMIEADITNEELEICSALLPKLKGICKKLMDVRYKPGNKEVTIKMLHWEESEMKVSGGGLMVRWT